MPRKGPMDTSQAYMQGIRRSSGVEVMDVENHLDLLNCLKLGTTAIYPYLCSECVVSYP